MDLVGQNGNSEDSSSPSDASIALEMLGVPIPWRVPASVFCLRGHLTGLPLVLWLRAAQLPHEDAVPGRMDRWGDLGG